MAKKKIKKLKKVEKKNNTKSQVVKEEVKEEVVVKEKETKKVCVKDFFKKYYIDIILIVVVMALGVFLHGPSLKTDKNYSHYLNEDGLQYMFDMDSYYYARKAKEFSTGEEKELIKERSHDKLQTKISDSQESYYTLLLPKVVAIIHKIINIFKNVDIYAVVVYSGPLLSMLVCIPAYIFVRRKTNRVGAVLSAVLAVSASSYFSHQNYASFDTDILLYTIPLLFMISYIESACTNEKKSRNIFWTLSIISYILLILLWDVYGIYYFLCVGLFFVYLFFALIKEKFNIKNVIKLSEIQNTFVLLICFTILSFIFRGGIETSIISSVMSIIKPSGFSGANYPSPSRFVAELSSVPFFGSFGELFNMSTNNIVNRLGGIFVILFYFIGMLILLYKTIKYFKGKDEDSKIGYILFITLFIWSIGGMISIKSGARFVKIAVIPINIIAGLSIGYVYNYFKSLKIGFPIIFIMIGLCISPCLYVYQVAKNSTPSVDRALENSANYINENISKDAVIASWWDFGYFYEYTTKRRAIGDGGTYNGRYFYFLANGFITKDQKTSANIFKMLSYKGVTASELMDEYVGNAKDGCTILMKLLSLDKEEALKVLKTEYKFDDEKANKIVELTHPTLDYDLILVITENMQRMKTAMSYYAFYDFEHDEAHMDWVTDDTMLISLFHNDKDTKYFKHLTRIDDILERYGTNIWLIK